MSEYRNIHAVIDNYHEGAFPVIAICPTHEAAEEYIADRIKEDKRKGNNYDLYFFRCQRSDPFPDPILVYAAYLLA